MKSFMKAFILVLLALAFAGAVAWLNTPEKVNVISDKEVADSTLTNSLVVDTLSNTTKINKIIDRVK